MIPYTIERRADTGVTNVTLGLWLFLASEAMLFGSLFSAYALLRTSAPSWPSGRASLHVAIAAINTIVLFALTAAAWRARSAPLPRGRHLLGLCSLLGTAFLLLKGLEYRQELGAGFRPSTSTFFATYFLLTGMHAVHVAGGIIANAWAIGGMTRVRPEVTAGRIRALSVYWAFVDLIWLCVFVLVYLT